MSKNIMCRLGKPAKGTFQPHEKHTQIDYSRRIRRLPHIPDECMDEVADVHIQNKNRKRGVIYYGSI